MFGLSFGEIVLLVIVAIVVVGPRNLPSMMRTAGQWVSRIRRMSTDLRAQSGIDQLLRDEGLERDLREIKSLANVNVLDSLERLAQPTILPATAGAAAAAAATAATPERIVEDRTVLREREYPLVGCDAYDAQPDDAAPSPYPMPVPTEAPTFVAEKDPAAS
ncbi:Sec-independent protein translocase protein TatB [Polyangium aurulentum]|uniref:Sec-independent protein translocase protein TatB n=1 Tax=Polyangium aurulentum TaxID=2567896 RepID=UPI0010AEBD99|nr:Sec-independent protein translocase protein TatB [Polyangium aurulentum]UQA56314.1 Sec-independent protein translocase protein TatB [Polyangium aurulentum]